MGGLNAGGRRQNSRFPTSIWLHRVLSTLRPVLSIRCRPTWQVVTLIVAGSKRPSLLMAGDDEDEMFMARSLNVTPTATEHLIVGLRSDKI